MIIAQHNGGPVCSASLSCWITWVIIRKLNKLGENWETKHDDRGAKGSQQTESEMNSTQQKQTMVQEVSTQ